MWSLVLLLFVPVVFATSSCPAGITPPCSCIIPQQNVTWDQLSGTWYLVETISPVPSSRSDFCAGIILSNTGSNSGIKAGFEGLAGNEPTFTNFTLNATTPSSWKENENGVHTHVVYLASDGSALGLSSCLSILDWSYQWNGIFTRVPQPEENILNRAHAGLLAANVDTTENAQRLNNTGCNY